MNRTTLFVDFCFVLCSFCDWGSVCSLFNLKLLSSFFQVWKLADRSLLTTKIQDLQPPFRGCQRYNWLFALVRIPFVTWFWKLFNVVLIVTNGLHRRDRQRHGIVEGRRQQIYVAWAAPGGQVGSRDRGWRRWREFLANNSWFLRSKTLFITSVVNNSRSTFIEEDRVLKRYHRMRKRLSFTFMVKKSRSTFIEEEYWFLEKYHRTGAIHWNCFVSSKMRVCTSG